jgi:regulator of protease activity HflC (stomatin/prohibitin superfamily)
MRSELGKIQLDSVFKERESLNIAIVEAINKASLAWGITCLRYEIRDIKLPNRVQEAMQMQVEAERRKRAAILESEGMREAEINVAEGKKRSQILASEGWKTEQINRAQGEASAILAKAQARSKSLRLVADALSKSHGGNAASFQVAEQYIGAFSKLAKTSNTILLPSNTGDASSMVAQAMGIYNALNQGKPSSVEYDASSKGETGGRDPGEYFSDEEPAYNPHEASEAASEFDDKPRSTDR